MNLDSRRAVESLRAGVPNREAVKFLGLGQPKIGNRFSKLLETLETSPNAPSTGFIIGGEFGSGKSHILQALKSEALGRNFAASFVTISKETPLSSLDDVFKAAIRELTLPDRRPGDLNEVALKLEPTSEVYRAFAADLRNGNLPIDPLFAATLLLTEKISGNEELRDYIYAFWAGGRINTTTIKKELRHLANPGVELGKSPKLSDLPPDRFTFASGLMRAAGYKGWIVLLDEVELIASLPLRARARSYAELSWLLGHEDRKTSGLGVVAAATQEFNGEIFREKQDDKKIPLSRIAERDPKLVERAVKALRVIADVKGNWESIVAQSSGDLDRVFRDARELYRKAFDWEGESPKRPSDSALKSSMRMHMREWITRWDLERLDPTYSAHIVVETVTPNLTEREGLEGFSEPSEIDDDINFDDPTAVM